MSMVPFNKGVFLRLAGVAALAIAGFSLGTRTTAAEEWNKSYTVTGRAHVRVDTNDGAVRVSTGDSKQVELRVIYDGYKLDKNLSVSSRQDGDNVEISARAHSGMGWNWGINHQTLRIEVHMPREADL